MRAGMSQVSRMCASYLFRAWKLKHAPVGSGKQTWLHSEGEFLTAGWSTFPKFLEQCPEKDETATHQPHRGRLAWLGSGLPGHSRVPGAKPPQHTGTNTDHQTRGTKRQNFKTAYIARATTIKTRVQESHNTHCLLLITTGGLLALIYLNKKYKWCRSRVVSVFITMITAITESEHRNDFYATHLKKVMFCQQK